MSISSPLEVMIPAGDCANAPGLEFYRQVFDNLYDGVYYVDRDRRILFWNKGAERITGLNPDEVIGRYCNDCLLDHLDRTGCHLCVNSCPLVRALHEGEPTSERVSLRHRDGWRIVVDIQVMPVRDHRGVTIGAVEVFRDASSLVALEAALAKLRDMAMSDPLTGLANRRHIDDMLDHQLALYRRVGCPFSVLMADLDHFKRINDTHGHPVGDSILMRFAAIAQSICRSGDLVGRFGGEEFLILLPEIHLKGAIRIAERLRAAVADRGTPEGVPPGAVTVSLGVTEVARGDSTGCLLRRVDEALYQAKAAGRNRVESLIHLPHANARLLPTQGAEGSSRIDVGHLRPLP